MKNLVKNFKVGLDKLINGIFPDKYSCIYCGKELPSPKRLGLCAECEREIIFAHDICLKCGRVKKGDGVFCDNCIATDRNFDKARSSVVYEGIAKELDMRLKFGSGKYLAKYLSAFMVDTLLENELFSNVVISVPLSKKRKRMRGYNQSEELAIGVSKALKMNYVKGVVVKTKDNLMQAKLSGKEREENVIGVYEVAKPEVVKGKSVLLIDDVLTTGATTGEIARVLKKAGADKVDVLVFASPQMKTNNTVNKLEDIKEEINEKQMV